MYTPPFHQFIRCQFSFSLSDEAGSRSDEPTPHRIPRGRILRDQNYRAQLATTLP